MTEKEWLNNDESSLKIYNKKYRRENESFDDFVHRVSLGQEDIKSIVKNREGLMSGRIMTAASLSDLPPKGIKKLKRWIKTNIFRKPPKSYKGAGYSSCAVATSPQDSRTHIFEVVVPELQECYAKGQGLGVYFGNLCPKGAKINGIGGTSSGSVSYAEMVNMITATIGTNRRGAAMITLPIWHPDVEDLICAKDKPDIYKAYNNLAETNESYEDFIDRITMGDIELKKILKDTDGKFSCANISIELTDDFMKAVEHDENWVMSFYRPETGETIERTTSAKRLLRLMASHAHKTGEPGCLFIDTINDYHVLSEYPDIKINATNPCFAGEMRVAMADERFTATFKELAEVGQDVPVYSYGSDGISIKMGRRPRKTGEKVPMLKISYDDGTYSRVTPNHPFKLTNNQEVEAKDLKKGDSIPSMQRSYINGRWVIAGTNTLPTVEQMYVANFQREFRGDRPLWKNGASVPIESKDERLQRCQSLTNLPCYLNEEANTVFVRKICETCGKPFNIPWGEREICYCSEHCIPPAEPVKVYTPIEEQIQVYRDLKLKLEKIPTQTQWKEACELKKIPSELNNTYKAFKQQAESYNHRVISVEEDGFDDSYTMTVDINHTLAITSDLNGESFVFAKQCGEQPLIDNATCNLFAINVAEMFVDGKFHYTKLANTVASAVKYMDLIIDVNIPLLPLKKQQEVVRKYRHIGIGVMGVADALVKIGLKYGSPESLHWLEAVMSTVRNAAYMTSALLAKEKGKFPGYKKEYIEKSEFFNCLPGDVQNLVKKHGLRNAGLISIAPTGSISTMLGVSGGLEPIFALKFDRKTQSLDGKDTAIEQYPKIIKDHLEKHGNLSADYLVTSHQIPWRERIEMQSTAQKYVDSAISSTINLPNRTTIKEVENIYMEAWKAGCKGITVYRDGCARAGVLKTANTCPECGKELKNQNGCISCECGFAVCGG